MVTASLLLVHLGPRYTAWRERNILSLFVTIVCWLVLRVCSTVLSEFLCPLPRPHHFVVAGIVCHTCLSVCAILCKFITVERRVLNRAAGQQISARQKQSAASERRGRHDDVTRPSLEVSTTWFRSIRSGEKRGRSGQQFGGNIGQQFWVCCERTNMTTVECCEESLWGVKECRVRVS